jgi:hypothetical protein
MNNLYLEEMTRIRVTKYGMVHFYAQCKECEWDSGIGVHGSTRQDVRNAVNAHVRKTGHRVTIETGTSTDYHL